MAFRLQYFTFQLQKLRFVYKYLVFILQSCIWAYKMASCLTIELVNANTNLLKSNL